MIASSRMEKYKYLRIGKAEKKMSTDLMFETILCLKSFDSFQLYFNTVKKIMKY